VQPQQIITNVKGSSRLRDARRPLSEVKSYFQTRTRRTVEISSHGNDRLASFSVGNNDEHGLTTSNSISSDRSSRCVGTMELYPNCEKPAALITTFLV
jgi:hypothetical protein